MRRLRLFLAMACAAGAVLAATECLAQTEPPTQKRFLTCKDFPKSDVIPCNSPSFDTTPTRIEWIGFHYLVPRNYIVVQPPGIPTFRVSYPKFEPLTEANQQCFTPIARFDRKGCTYIEFWLGGKGLDSAAQLGNMLHSSVHYERRHDRNGFDVYHSGPGTFGNVQGIDTYAKVENGLMTFVHCFPNGTKAGAVCSSDAPLEDGASFHAFYTLDQVPLIPAIQARIRALMASFSIKGD